MKKLFYLIILFFSLQIQSFSQNKLAMLYSSAGMEYGKASAIDASNNYINGSLFQNTISVNPNGTTNLSAPGLSTQLALCKYNSEGQLLWGKHMGGTTTSEAPHGIATDANNNIYITGYFGSTTLTGVQNANFNPAGGGTISSQGNEDIFVAKYDSNGNYLWAFGIGNIGQETQERAWDIATDNAGNSYVVGGFHGTMNFNPLGTAMNYTIADATAGLFIAKYNTNGICQWVNILDVKGNSVFTETYATCDLDAYGNLYVAGNFRGSNVNFNPLGNSEVLSSAGQNDIFIAKYNTASGLLSWTKRIGSPLQDLVSSGAVRCDKNGNPYFTGRLSGTNTVNFDPNGGVTNISNSALYITSYDSLGNLRFAKGMNSGAGDGGHRVSFDNNNNVFVAGWMNGTATFGTISRIANSPTADNFLAKYTNDLSTCYWALNFGGSGSTSNNIVAGLSIDHDNNPIITGQLFGTNANINPLGTSPLNLSSIGNNDCFVVKYKNDGSIWESSLLPIKLLSFTGINNEYNNFLNWQTSTEINSNYFDIERSVNGIVFEKIGRTTASGNSSIIKSYSFTDNQIKNTAVLYYRLKQVDLDGRFDYSKTILINAKNNNGISTFPNPTITTLNVTYNTQKASSYVVSDNTGKVFKRGATTSQINISTLSKGSYQITFYDKSNNIISNHSFIKQ